MNKTAQMGGSFAGGMISLTISTIFLTSVFLPTVFTANTSGWDAQTVAIWAVVGVVSVAGFIYGVAAVFGIV